MRNKKNGSALRVRLMDKARAWAHRAGARLIKFSGEPLPAGPSETLPERLQKAMAEFEVVQFTYVNEDVPPEWIKKAKDLMAENLGRGLLERGILEIKQVPSTGQLLSGDKTEHPHGHVCLRGEAKVLVRKWKEEDECSS